MNYAKEDRPTAREQVRMAGKISLAVGLIASAVAVIEFGGYYVAPEQTEALMSSILSNPITSWIRFGIYYCGACLAPLSLLSLLRE